MHREIFVGFVRNHKITNLQANLQCVISPKSAAGFPVQADVAPRVKSAWVARQLMSCPGLSQFALPFFSNPDSNSKILERAYLHQIMLISLISISFDRFHFHGVLKSKRMVILKSCHISDFQGFFLFKFCLDRWGLQSETTTDFQS